jgi:hypothetical protein
VVKDAKKWEVEPESAASEFDVGYFGKLLEKVWEEVGFVFIQGFLLVASVSAFSFPAF